VPLDYWTVNYVNYKNGLALTGRAPVIRALSAGSRDRSAEGVGGFVNRADRTE